MSADRDDRAYLWDMLMAARAVISFVRGLLNLLQECVALVVLVLSATVLVLVLETFADAGTHS